MCVCVCVCVCVYLYISCLNVMYSMCIDLPRFVFLKHGMYSSVRSLLCQTAFFKLDDCLYFFENTFS